MSRPIFEFSLHRWLEIRRSWRGTPEDRFIHNWTPAYLADEWQHSQRIVLATQGEAIAVLSYRPQAPGEIHIMTVLVHFDHVDRGWGGKLFEGLSERVSRGRLLVEVHELNQRARRLYQRWGFEELGRRPGYYPDGGAAVVLQRVGASD
jgi:ribosomal-protein-alanine N-acetyltransferase